jgi:hypothetical protein
MHHTEFPQKKESTSQQGTALAKRHPLAGSSGRTLRKAASRAMFDNLKPASHGFAMLGLFGRDRRRCLAGLVGVRSARAALHQVFRATHALLRDAPGVPVSTAGGALDGQDRLSRIARTLRHT